MKPILILLTLSLTACMTNPEPRVVTISCGTLPSHSDDPDDPSPPIPPADTFAVVDGECRKN